MYLHELHRIKRYAVPDKRPDLQKGDRFGKEPLQPEEDVSADNGFDVVLIDGRVRFTDGIPVRTGLVSADDRVLVDKRDPVVGDDRSKEQGMGPAAFRAPDPADPEELCSIRKKDAPLVISMNGKTCRVPAGARKAVKGEVVYDGIVIILRKLIVITDRNEYHGLVRHSPKQL